MIEYWQSLTQNSQVAILIASIAGVCSVLAAAIRSYFKLGLKFLALGISGFFGIAGCDYLTFDDTVPHICPKSGCERSPLIAKFTHDHKHKEHADKTKPKGKGKGKKGKDKGRKE